MKSGRRARLLFVGAFPPFDREVFGGQVTACRSLLQSSLPLRFDLDLIDSTQIANPPPALPIRLLLALRRFARFARAFERRRPDAVLLFVAVGMSLVEKGLMAWYARFRGVPALMSPRAAPSMYGEGGVWFTRALTRLAFGGVAGVICQSATWRRFAISTLHFDESQTHVIANWTATPELVAIGRSRSWPRHGDTRLLFVGWVDKEKGIAELLDACRVLRQRFRFTLDIAGEGNYLSQAREFVAANNLSETVRFHGWVLEPTLHRLLAASDVFVLPSWAEGLPNAMIEAMAAGLAVVVTGVGGIPAVVTAGANAIVVPPRDPESLTAAIADLLDNRDELARIAAGGVQLAGERFSVEPAVELIEAAVLGAIAQTPARAREAVS